MHTPVRLLSKVSLSYTQNMTTDTAPHLIAFADATDVAFLSSSLERLPADAYGTVFIEVPSPAAIEGIATAEGVSITWLVNTEHHHGHRLMSAARAWAAEWSLPGDTHEQYHLWIGCAGTLTADRIHAEMHAACGHPAD